MKNIYPYGERSMIEIKLPISLRMLEIILTALGKEADMDFDLHVICEDNHLVIYRDEYGSKG